MGVGPRNSSSVPLGSEHSLPLWIFSVCLLPPFFLFFNYLFLFLAVLGLRCCARAFSNCGEQGLLFVAVRGLLSWLLLLQSTGSRHVGFSSCSTQAQ